jgi:hypothetical protein
MPSAAYGCGAVTPVAVGEGGLTDRSLGGNQAVKPAWVTSVDPLMMSEGLGNDKRVV